MKNKLLKAMLWDCVSLEGASLAVIFRAKSYVIPIFLSQIFEKLDLLVQISLILGLLERCYSRRTFEGLG